MLKPLPATTGIITIINFETGADLKQISFAFVQELLRPAQKAGFFVSANLKNTLRANLGNGKK